MEFDGRDPQGAMADGFRKALGLFTGVKKVFLPDYPDYHNIGDSMIWMGSLTFLRHAGVEVAGQVSSRRCNISSLERILGDADIVLQGGGNFGDIYPRHGESRRRIIEKFRDRKIIMFPQTLYYRDPSLVKRDQIVYGRHPNLTLMWRDAHSLEMGRRHFGDNASFLVPDMAFCLNIEVLGKESKGEGKGILFHDRSIDQPAGPETDSAPVDIPGARRTDWTKLVPHRVLRDRMSKHYGRLAQATAILPSVLYDRAQGLLWSIEAQRRRRRMQNALSFASRFYKEHQIVVTNRLHAHILSVLLRIRNIVLDGGYGKVRWFFDTWTCRDPLSRLCAPADLGRFLKEMQP